MVARPLNTRQQRFCDFVLSGENQTDAYIHAGFTQDRESAKKHASRLMQHPKVIAYVTKVRKEATKQAGINKKMWLKEMMRIGFADVRKLYDEKDKLKEPKDFDEDTARAVSGLIVTEMTLKNGAVRTTKKITFWDKRAALVDIGEHMGYFPKKKIDLTTGGKALPEASTKVLVVPAFKGALPNVQELASGKNGNGKNGNGKHEDAEKPAD